MAGHPQVHRICPLLMAALGLGSPLRALTAESYHASDQTMAGTTVVLTGHDLSIEQLVAIARHGAKVQLSAEARQAAADSFGLILEAQAEGVPVYLFNRSPGSGRENVSLKGDPGSPEFQAELERRWAAPGFSEGGFGGEVPDEEVGRAMLAVDLNNMRYLAASAGYVQGIIDLLNAGVTPAVYWRGAIGEADFVPTGTVLRGRGAAYYKGVRLPAAEALRKAGLKPVHFEGADANLLTTSALTAGYAALLVHDVRRLIEWHDLIWALDLLAMNGSIAPLSMPVQATRPFVWANYAAARTLDMLKGSYVFNGEYRIIQDPESLRATVWRDAGLWQAWARLRDSTLIQMNSTDHNPTVRPDVSPGDSWELATPQLMKYFVRGGRYSNGKHGFIFSNSDWDPYPLLDDVEALPIALQNLMVVVVQRLHRFEDTFFTVTDPRAVLKAHGGTDGISGAGGGGGGAIADALWQELKPLANPVPPDGVTADKGVGDIDAVPMLKLVRLHQAIEVSRDILGQDLLNAAAWLDIRKLEDPTRDFGAAPTAAWRALRTIIPFRRDPSAAPPAESSGTRISAFIAATPASSFYAPTAAMPGGDEVRPPLAETPQAKVSR
ncbi:MAG: aromatic amino acid ammonia-lyase [Steroidobacteraceae bacterium]|jgi:histidine ammonia-lyase